ncbi:hypothetical protein PRO82_000541 [Candidatus Protochlamydia amoebophila]|uniref:hypothetical protein n=1 Tax=Candidatus Protochlamydia amoebophila TaxID=362787 RepID=UPI001BC90E8B|nr:hypothetical protein [Candidatus Protochlamydia amoebophila]MBS4163241.1 hypothetical protein [Candidatus Protochlamydia amoebophila]
MKDFHDLYSIISSSQLPLFYNLEGVIRLVFKHRETPLTFPITYAENEMKQVQNFWNEYLKNLRVGNSADLPIIITQIIATINNWLRLNTGLVGSDK